MRRLAQWKILVGTLMLLIFGLSVNGLEFGKHAAAELAVALASAEGLEKLTECPYDHSGSDRQRADAEGHCCHQNHSHDLQDGPNFVISLPLPAYLPKAVEPHQYLPEVYLERFVPPQNHS